MWSRHVSAWSRRCRPNSGLDVLCQGLAEPQSTEQEAAQDCLSRLSGCSAFDCSLAFWFWASSPKRSMIQLAGCLRLPGDPPHERAFVKEGFPACSQPGEVLYFHSWLGERDASQLQGPQPTRPRSLMPLEQKGTDNICVNAELQQDPRCTIQQNRSNT